MFIDHKLLFKTPESWWGRRTPTTVSSPHRPGHHQPLRVIKHHGKWFLAWKQQYFYMIGTKQSWCMRHCVLLPLLPSSSHLSSTLLGITWPKAASATTRLQSFMKLLQAKYWIFEHSVKYYCSTKFNARICVQGFLCSVCVCSLSLQMINDSYTYIP